MPETGIRMRLFMSFRFKIIMHRPLHGAADCRVKSSETKWETRFRISKLYIKIYYYPLVHKNSKRSEAIAM